MVGTKPDLRKEIASWISRAIDSSVNYTGKEYDLNRHNWVQITTDRIIAAFMYSLPQPVDIQAKYETGPEGIYVTVSSEEEENKNGDQLTYLAKFADDQGYNRCIWEIQDYLKRLYTLPDPVLQSGHEQTEFSESGPQQENPDQPDDKEPSQVR